MTDKKLSPNQQHERVKGNLIAYIRKLEETNQKFPVNNEGNVNLSEVARICECKRGVFQKKNNGIGRTLTKAIERIGTEAKSQEESESLLKKMKDNAQKDSSKLSKELERTTAEVEKLRHKTALLEQENKALKNKLNGQTNAMDAMLDDGKRRFIWE